VIDASSRPGSAVKPGSTCPIGAKVKVDVKVNSIVGLGRNVRVGRGVRVGFRMAHRVDVVVMAAEGIPGEKVGADEVKVLGLAAQAFTSISGSKPARTTNLISCLVFIISIPLRTIYAVLPDYTLGNLSEPPQALVLGKKTPQIKSRLFLLYSLGLGVVFSGSIFTEVASPTTIITMSKRNCNPPP
jgi:hypothetical protein